MMLPLSLSSDGGPIFVNAKQYNGIMRRRKKRAEAELHNNLLKIRKVRRESLVSNRACFNYIWV